MKDSASLAQYSPEKTILRDRVILITGAGDGIGKAAALACAAHGATTILVGRTLSKLEAVYDEIEAQNYAQPAIFPLNLASATEQDFKALYQAIEDTFGRLDSLLHNAAELGPRTLIKQYDAEKLSTLLQVNVTAPFLLTKALLPLLEQSSDARIVFTGSGVGLKGKAYWGAYAVSKAATENLMQVIADEYDGHSSIRCNSINPGPVRTSIRAAAFPAEDPSTVVEAETIMNRYIYLLGPDSRQVNGQQLNAQSTI